MGEQDLRYVWGKINACFDTDWGKKLTVKINEDAAIAVDCFYHPEKYSESFMSMCSRVAAEFARPIISVQMRSSFNTQDYFGNFLLHVSNNIMVGSKNNYVLKFVGVNGFVRELLSYCGAFYWKVLSGEVDGFKMSTPIDSLPDPKRRAIRSIRKAIQELELTNDSGKVINNYWDLSSSQKDQVVAWVREKIPNNKTLIRGEFEYYLEVVNNSASESLSFEEEDGGGNRDIPDNNNNPENIFSDLKYSMFVEVLNTIKKITKPEDFDIAMLYLLHIFYCNKKEELVSEYLELGSIIDWTYKSTFFETISRIRTTYGTGRVTIPKFIAEFGVKVSNYSYRIKVVSDAIKRSQLIPVFYKTMFSVSHEE